MKTCFKCNRSLDLSSFYAHPKMADGHLNKCKECTRGDTRRNYASSREKHAAYERARETTVNRKEKKAGYTSKHRANNPQKYAARTAVSNALRDGRITKEPCSKCGDEKSQAHHHDYSRPLDVEWLCHGCHMNEHGKSQIGSMPRVERDNA